MGGLTSYKCKSCGYDSGELTLGPGPNPDEFDPVLVSCSQCKRLRVVHRPEIGRGCPKCSGKLRTENEDKKVKCPRCGKTLKKELVALWD